MMLTAGLWLGESDSLRSVDNFAQIDDRSRQQPGYISSVFTGLTTSDPIETGRRPAFTRIRSRVQRLGPGRIRVVLRGVGSIKHSVVTHDAYLPER